MVQRVWEYEIVTVDDEIVCSMCLCKLYRLLSDVSKHGKAFRIPFVRLESFHTRRHVCSIEMNELVKTIVDAGDPISQYALCIIIVVVCTDVEKRLALWKCLCFNAAQEQVETMCLVLG